MNGDSALLQFAEEIDFILAERRSLAERGIHIIVEHRNHKRGTICAAGETIGDILLGGPAPRSFGFSDMSLLLVDCLCRYRLPLSAEKIGQIMCTDPFYVHYAGNVIGRNHSVSRPKRRSVRSCVHRAQRRMGAVFIEAGLNLDPRTILVSQASEASTLVYRLRATMSLIHIPE